MWCTTALPTGRGPAETLRAHLRARGEVTADSLELAAVEPLRDLAQQLDAVLRTASADVSPIGGRPVLGAAERALLRDGRRDGEAMAGDRVLTGDVVVLHDALTAVVAEAVRERGAHVVWEVKVSQGAPVRQVWDFLRDATSAIDAFAMSWEGPGHEGRAVERLAAVMPGADAVATTEIATAPRSASPTRTSAGPGCSRMSSAAGAPSASAARVTRGPPSPGADRDQGQPGRPRDRLGASRRGGRIGRCGPGRYSTAGCRPHRLRVERHELQHLVGHLGADRQTQLLGRARPDRVVVRPRAGRAVSPPAPRPARRACAAASRSRAASLT